MKQYKPLSKLVKKIGNVILPLISERRYIGNRFRDSLSGQVTFQNLRLYKDERSIYYFKVDVVFEGLILKSRSHLNEDQVKDRLELGTLNWGLKSYLYLSKDYHTSDRKTKVQYTKRVKDALNDYLSINLYRMVKINHLLPDGVVNECSIDKIIYK